MLSRPELFAYPGGSELSFELRMREQILNAAKALNSSGAGFSTFATDRCNPEYWIREPNGAFRLRSDRSPSAAIRDIFMNGRQYAFECATAIVIVLYKACLETIGENAYNNLFGNTYLFHWIVDRDLGLLTHPSTRFIPGDALYFDNPEYDPAMPQWQGENLIYMGDDQYYGHGIGITNAQRIIETLNSHRFPGAAKSAFLLPQATRPSFVKLAQSSAALGNATNPGIFGSTHSAGSGFGFGSAPFPFFRASIGSTLYLLG
jgi:protein-glutamine gamma-glutamyltransferase